MYSDKPVIEEKERSYLVLRAVEDVKPPSPFKYYMLFFLTGLAGGVGLGFLIGFIS